MPTVVGTGVDTADVIGRGLSAKTPGDHAMIWAHEAGPEGGWAPRPGFACGTMQECGRAVDRARL